MRLQWNKATECMAMREILTVTSIMAHMLQGPLDNLFDHLANPTGVTFATNGVSLPFVH